MMTTPVSEAVQALDHLLHAVADASGYRGSRDGDAVALVEHVRSLAGIYAEVKAERVRAHAKHGATSMESAEPFDLFRLTILVEEIGEVAKEINDARHRGDAIDRAAVRKELIQVAAMATAWADRLTENTEGS